MTAAAYIHRQAGTQASLVQFSWPPSEAASRQSEEHLTQSSVRRVGITGVQAGLCGCGGAVVMGSR